MPPSFRSPGVKGKGLLYVQTPGMQALKAELAQYKASAQTLEKASVEINRRAVAWLSREATRELKARIKGRGRQQSRNQTLVNLASNYKSNSSWGTEGFKFFDPKVVRFSKAFPYYRAIEAGSRRNIGQRVRLTFFDGGQQVLPPSARYRQVADATDAQRAGSKSSAYTGKNLSRAKSLTKRENIDSLKDYATYSGRNGTPYVVTIRNPIRAYRYIETAANRFQAEHVYSNILAGIVRQRAPLLARTLKLREGG